MGEKGTLPQAGSRISPLAWSTLRPLIPPGQVTDLLLSWGNGDESALARLMPLVHDELHRLASRQMRGERHGTSCRRPRS